MKTENKKGAENNTEVKAQEQNTSLVVLTKTTTAQERIEKAEQFDILAGRFDYLKTKKADLEKFVLKNDGLSGCRLSVISNAGAQFEVQNTTIIGELLTLCNVKLNGLLNEAENEVLNFKI